MKRVSGILSRGDEAPSTEPSPTPVMLERRGAAVVAMPLVQLPALTTDVVRLVLERVRR